MDSHTERTETIKKGADMSDEFFDPFAEDYSTEEIDKENLNTGGGGKIMMPGRYHVQIQNVEYDAGDVKDEGDKKIRKLPTWKVQMEVLAGDNESEIGKKQYAFLKMASWYDEDDNNHYEDGQMFRLTQKALKDLIAFLYAFGVVDDDVFGQESVKLTKQMFELLDQTQALIKIDYQEEKKSKKTGDIIPAGTVFWTNQARRLDFEEWEDCPKDVEALAYAQSGSVPDEGMEDI